MTVIHGHVTSYEENWLLDFATSFLEDALCFPGYSFGRGAEKESINKQQDGFVLAFPCNIFSSPFQSCNLEAKKPVLVAPNCTTYKKNSRKSEENPSGSQFRFKPQSYRAPTWGLYIKVATTQIGIPLTPKDLTSFRGPNIWRY